MNKDDVKELVVLESVFFYWIGFGFSQSHSCCQNSQCDFGGFQVKRRRAVHSNWTKFSWKVYIFTL